MAKISDVVAALARSAVFHGAAQPEDTQLVSEWLDELKNADDDATDDTTDDATDDKADDKTDDTIDDKTDDKMFKPTAKKTK